MAAVPVSSSEVLPKSLHLHGELLPPITADRKTPDWKHFLAAGTVVAGAALIASGRRRAGLTVTAIGTAMALVEEQESLKVWWKRAPAFLDQAQTFLDRADAYLKEATVQGRRLQGILRK
jgi:hypothetical protein